MDGIYIVKWLFCVIAILAVLSPLVAPQITMYLLFANTLLLSAVYIHSDRRVFQLTGVEKFDTMWKTKLIVVLAVFGILGFGLLYSWPAEIVINAVNLMLAVLGVNATHSAEAIK